MGCTFKPAAASPAGLLHCGRWAYALGAAGLALIHQALHRLGVCLIGVGGRRMEGARGGAKRRLLRLQGRNRGASSPPAGRA